MFGEIVLDGGLRFVDALEGAESDGVSDDVGKEPPHLVQPRSRGRRKAEMEARVFFQLFLDLGMLVRGLLVDNEMRAQALWRLPVRNRPLKPAPVSRKYSNTKIPSHVSGIAQIPANGTLLNMTNTRGLS